MASDGVHLPSAAPDTACFFSSTEVKPRLTSVHGEDSSASSLRATIGVMGVV